jgi:axial budding pattern protein 2
MLLPLLFTSIFGLALARVSVNYPLSDQLPAISRVSVPYEWKAAPDTFKFNEENNRTLTYSTSELPSWLTFDSSTLTFRGRPALLNKGHHEITLSASDGQDQASTRFTLPVSTEPPPKLQHDINSQFIPNPSLASVFPLHNGSALASDFPALRVPPQWSFSVGFEGNTFTTVGDLYYDARQADGSPLPSWIKFNAGAITFDGFAPPSMQDNAPPLKLSLTLHASDIKGYTAAALSFDLFVAAHELSIAVASLPTINVTSSTEFDIVLSSSADFKGILLDDRALEPKDIRGLLIDVSKYHDWLTFDESQRRLRGTPPSGTSSPLSLPANITIDGNQVLETTVLLAIVPSFFSANSLGPITYHHGDTVNFDLSTGFSSGSSSKVPEGIALSAEFEPTSAATFLRFDSTSARVTGTIPHDLPDKSISITLTAYSRLTESTSHASLVFEIASPAEHNEQSRHQTVATGFIIALAVLAGLLVFGVILAALRRYARVEDSALSGEEAQQAYSQEEKRYYGMGAGVYSAASSTSPERSTLGSFLRPFSRWG